MADTSVEEDVSNILDITTYWGPYWSDPSIGVIVFVDGGNDISFARTDDGGATWSTTEIEAGTARSFACWYDKETPGDAGTLIHLVWGDTAGGAGSEDYFYITIDVSDGSQGTKRTIDATVTVGNNDRVAITKTVGGNLLMAFETGVEIFCYRSVDSGVNWTTRTDVFETALQRDWLLFFPADTADDNDAVGIFWDRSENELSIKMYDDSANTWTETIIATDMIYNSERRGYDGVVRHSDSHVLIVAHSDDVDTDDDLRTWDLTVDSIASPTITGKANIFTNQGVSAQVGMIINQQNNDVYVAYIKGGTYEATVDVVYHKSDDDMATWETEEAYSEAAADDIRFVCGGRIVGDAGGRIQFTWYNDDLTEIFVNLVNDIEIAAVGVGVTVDMWHPEIQKPYIETPEIVAY